MHFLQIAGIGLMYIEIFISSQHQLNMVIQCLFKYDHANGTLLTKFANHFLLHNNVYIIYPSS